MKYIISHKYVIGGLIVAYAYVVYKIFEKELERGRCNSLFLLYEVMPAFYYFAAFILATVYLTALFRLHNCKELCFDVYGRKNLGFLGSLLSINVFFSAILMIILILYAYSKMGLDTTFYGYIVGNVMISYFFPACFAITCGFAIAYSFNVKTTCVITAVFMYITSPSFFSKSMMKADLQSYMLFIANFDFIQNSGGNSDYLYKWLKIIGFICVSVIPIVRLITKKNRVYIALLLIFFIGSEIFYYMPQDRSGEEYWALKSEAYYYKRSGDLATIRYDKESPFKIDSYDMDIRFTHMMSVKCDIKISPEDSDRDSYDFTLYHTYKIRKVMYDGKKISYKRDGDYISVGKLGEGVLSIYYYGTTEDFPVTSRYISLSEYFPYYPVAGKKRVYESDGVNNDYESLYRIKVNIKNFYTNLDKISTYVYESTCNGPYILKGPIEELDVKGYKVICWKYNDFYKIQKENLDDFIHEIFSAYPDANPKFIALNIGLSRYFKGGKIMVGNGYIEASERFKAEDVLDAEDNWDE